MGIFTDGSRARVYLWDGSTLEKDFLCGGASLFFDEHTLSRGSGENSGTVETLQSMYEYIKIGGRLIYLQSIVSVEYDETITPDGDVEDHEPAVFPADESTLLIRLSNGDEIKLDGEDASYFYHRLEAASSEVPKPTTSS